MKERMIVKKLSDNKCKSVRGGTALPKPIVPPPGVTLVVSYPGHGRGRGYGRGGKFGPINDFDSGTADA